MKQEWLERKDTLYSRCFDVVFTKGRERQKSGVPPVRIVQPTHGRDARATSLLPKQGGGAFLNLLRREIFLVCGNGPLMTEWIQNGAASVAVELVLHWPKKFRAGRNRAGGHGVCILEIEHQPDGRAANRLRTARVHFGRLVGEHNAVIANLDLGMHDLAARPWHAHELRGAESLLVKFDSTGAPVDDQVRRRC